MPAKGRKTLDPSLRDKVKEAALAVGDKPHRNDFAYHARRLGVDRRTIKLEWNRRVKPKDETPKEIVHEKVVGIRKGTRKAPLTKEAPAKEHKHDTTCSCGTDWGMFVKWD